MLRKLLFVLVAAMWMVTRIAVAAGMPGCPTGPTGPTNGQMPYLPDDPRSQQGDLSKYLSNNGFIYVCHDYTVYNVTREYPVTDPCDVGTLQKILKASQYTDADKYTAPQALQVQLQEGDVIVVGTENGHSGFVTKLKDGTLVIKHYIQTDEKTCGVKPDNMKGAYSGYTYGDVPDGREVEVGDVKVDKGKYQDASLQDMLNKVRYYNTHPDTCPISIYHKGSGSSRPRNPGM